MSALTTALALGLALSAADAKLEDAKTYAIDLTGTTQQVKAGAEGTLSLHIKPAKGFKISREAPLKISLSAAGLELAKQKLGHADADGKTNEDPKFAVAFAAKTAGEQAIEAKAVFFICNENLCERKTENLEVAIHVD